MQQKQQNKIGRPRGKKVESMTISLTFSTLDRLETEHMRRGISRSRIIEEALEAYLKISEFPYTPEEWRVQVQGAIAQSTPTAA